MKPVRCAYARRHLQEFHDQELPIAEQIAMATHVRACDGCAAELAELRLMGTVLRGSMPGRPMSADENTSLHAAIVSRVNAEQTLSLRVRLQDMFDDMHLVYAGLGAIAAAVVCLAVTVGMMRFASNEQPDSLAAIVRILSSPGSNQNPVRVTRPFIQMPRAIAEPSFSTPYALGTDTVVMLAAVVTREGRVQNLELLDANGGAPGGDETERAKLLEDLMGAVSKARFEPASVAGAPVAVNMVWIVAHTTVRASNIGQADPPKHPVKERTAAALAVPRTAWA